jgi:serine/threonine-protein kinase
VTDAISRLTSALEGRYRNPSLLGQGGMATVYLAQDLKHGRRVAIKVLRPEVAAAIGAERFLAEIRTTANLQHPHILPLYDSGSVAEYLYYVMPYVEGGTIRDRLAREIQLPVNEALRIVREAAQALEYAHLHGVIHRDIKPENLLLTPDGNTLVADFGIARDAGDGRRLTETGLSIGTPSYMSPEQASAEKTIDARTDVYSLGAVLYELLAGEPPFTGPTAQAIIAKRLSAPAPSLKVVRPEVPEAVDRVISHALARVPADRYATMTEFRATLDSLLLEQHVAAPSSRRGMRVGLLVAALAGILAVTGYFLLPGRRGGATGEASAQSAAVLPFNDESPGKDQEYFSDGLTEELTTALARLPGLRVVARSSAFQFKGSSVDVREVGRRLGVATILEGSVRRSGNRLRVSAQLVSAKDGYELWSDSYDRDQSDVFRVQEEIARAITGALRVRLSGGHDSALSRRPTRDLEAYDLYLKGRFAWNQRTETTLMQSAQYFEQAVARDSEFSRAWAGLADAYTLLPIYSSMSPATAWPRAKAAALRAIALDSSAEAYTSFAYGTMLYEWDWAASERAFRRAIAVDSAYPTAHHWYADFLAGRGRLDEALLEMGRAQELDPLSRIIGSEVGWMYNSLHRTDEADSALARVLQLDPNYAQALFVLAQIRIEQKRYPEAIAAARRSLEVGGFFGHGFATLVATYARAGERAKAMALLDSLTARKPHPSELAIAYANLGDRDRAFALLDRGIKERDVLLPENFFEPLFDPLKSDPRYRRVTALLGAKE